MPSDTIILKVRTLKEKGLTTSQIAVRLGIKSNMVFNAKDQLTEHEQHTERMARNAQWWKNHPNKLQEFVIANDKYPMGVDERT